MIQNAVSFAKLGVATSNLTFFRQIGGTVGLSVAGSFFGTQLTRLLPERLVANGIPQQLVDQFQGAGGAGFDLNNLVGVGTDLGAAILAGVPEQLRPIVEPYVPAIVTSIYEAISLAIVVGLLARRGSGGHRVRGGPRDPRAPAAHDARAGPRGPGRRRAPRPAPRARRPAPRSPRAAPPRRRRDPRRGDPAPPRRPGHRLGALRAGPRRRRAAAGGDRPGDPGRPRRPAGPRARRHPRHRRPLPPHGGAPLPRPARWLRRRLPAPQRAVRPGHRRGRPDADHRRARPRRPRPPDVVAARLRTEARAARQEGRGTAPDPRPAPPLLPRPDRRRHHRGAPCPGRPSRRPANRRKPGARHAHSTRVRDVRQARGTGPST